METRPFTKRHRIHRMLCRDFDLIVFLGGKSGALLCLLLNDIVLYIFKSLLLFIICLILFINSVFIIIPLCYEYQHCIIISTKTISLHLTI